MNINWIYLIVGGLFESFFATSLGKLQQSTGKEMIVWFLFFILSVSLSMFFLYTSMGGSNPIPTGTAYAVWAGIGAVFTVIFGIIFFNEPVTFWRLFFLTALIISIAGLQFVSAN